MLEDAITIIEARAGSVMVFDVPAADVLEKAVGVVGALADSVAVVVVPAADA